MGCRAPAPAVQRMAKWAQGFRIWGVGFRVQGAGHLWCRERRRKQKLTTGRHESLSKMNHLHVRARICARFACACVCARVHARV